MTTQAGIPYLILAGIDYSNASELALERALELAAVNSNAELHVVHVAPDLDTSPQAGDTATFASDSRILHQKASMELENHVSVSVGAFEKKRGGAAHRTLRVVCHLRFHSPAHEISQLASDLQADLVVVGMHGRNAVARFFIGSVAESVTRLAPCPVLVFRPKGLPPEYPRIEPPCPRCVDERVASAGTRYWCEQHREHHGQRHVYYQTDHRSEDVELPLVGNTSVLGA
jgi:nucleotide-binding universal stress UspA family protein